MPTRTSGGRRVAPHGAPTRRRARRPDDRRPRPAAGKRSAVRTRPRARPGGDSQAPGRRLLRRSLKLAVLVLAAGAVCAGAYAAALETSMFAFQRLVIVGGTPAVDAQVRAALAPEQGQSLLRISGAEVDRAAAGLPGVVSLRFVRSFPHTLRVVVTPERPVLLVRSGRLGFVVSARGRVMAETRAPAASVLPRLWMPTGAQLSVGETLNRADGLLAAATAAALAPRSFGGVASISDAGGNVAVLTRSGFQVRLGDIGDLRLKLAIAQRIIAYAGAGISDDAYVDVSVPPRPVLGSKNPQLAGRG